MRTEAIEKEASMFNRDGDCYIHIERTSTSPYTFIIAGDPAVICQATYNMISQCANELNISFPEMMKRFKTAYKKYGFQEKVVMDTE
jgi:hypothetical protein